MITAAEFNSKLTELNTEYLKIIDAGNIAEAFRWLRETIEFLEALIEEADMLDDLTKDEKCDLFNDGKSVRNMRYWMGKRIIERIKEDNQP